MAKKNATDKVSCNINALPLKTRMRPYLIVAPAIGYYDRYYDTVCNGNIFLTDKLFVPYAYI